jgi:hypothetical protein
MTKKSMIVIAGSFVLALVLGSGTNILAQIGDCAFVYSNAVKDTSVTQIDVVRKSLSYNFLCEQDGSVRTSSFGLNLKAIIEEIPIGLSAAGSDSSAQVKLFCKIGFEQKGFTLSTSTFDNTVVVDALRSFNECRALELRGFKIFHKESVPESVSIYGEITKSGLRAFLSGILYDKNKLKCTSTSFTGNGAQEVLDPEKFKARQVNPQKNTFQINCKRIPEKKAGSQYFRYTPVQVTTTEGIYGFSLAENQLQGFELASSAAQENNRIGRERDQALANLAATQAVVTSLQTAVANVQARLANVSVRTTLYGTGENREQMESWGFNWVGRYDGSAESNAWIARFCAGSQAVVQRIRSHAGNCCGYTYSVVTCIDRP